MLPDHPEAIDLLREIVEHIDLIPERKLLALDSDPHPPSVLSVLAERAREIIEAQDRQGNDAAVPEPELRTEGEIQVFADGELAAVVTVTNSRSVVKGSQPLAEAGLAQIQRKEAPHGA